MPKRIPDDFIEKVKEANSIADVAGDFFSVKQVGSIFQSFCPDHKEKVPSLTLFPETETFYCFSCGAGKKNKTGSSDVIAFVQWVNNCSWMEAINYLAHRKGMIVPKQDLSPEDKEKQKLYEQCLLQNRAYWSHLQDNQEYIDYFLSRGFTKEDIDIWRLGFVPHEDPTKVASRVVFAIINDWGQTVGFSYRNMEDVFPNKREADRDSGPKYYNSPQSPIFNKGSILYGLHNIKRLIREKDYIVVGEGFGDTILAQNAGLPFVSIMGTAFTNKHIDIIKRYTNNIVMWMDGDTGGINAVLRMLDPLRDAGFNVSIVHTPNQDPDDVIQEVNGNIEEWIENNKRLAGQFEIDLILDKYRSKLSELKFVIVDELRPIFARITSPLEKEIYAEQAAHDLGISKKIFLDKM